MKTKLACIFWILISAVLVWASPAGPPPISLFIEPTQGAIHTGSRVELKLTLTNTSPLQITIRDTNRWCDYGLEVRDSRGRPVPETAYKRGLECGSHVSVGRKVIQILKPGESYEDTMFINQLYDLTAPGTYFILASRVIPRELGTGRVNSNMATVAIVR